MFGKTLWLIGLFVCSMAQVTYAQENYGSNEVFVLGKVYIDWEPPSDIQGYIACGDYFLVRKNLQEGEMIVHFGGQFDLFSLEYTKQIGQRFYQEVSDWEPVSKIETIIDASAVRPIVSRATRYDKRVTIRLSGAEFKRSPCLHELRPA